MNTPKLLSASLLSLTVTLGACAAQNDVELTNEDYDDIAVGIGSLVAMPGGGGEVGSMADASATATSGSLLDVELGVASAEGSSAHEVVIRAGLEYEYLVDCFDADGAAQDACGELTDSAAVSLSWSGELDTPRYDATITRAGEWSLTGLQGDTAELNGTGSFDASASFTALYRDVSRSLELSYDAQYQGVLIDTATHQVVGGSISYSVQGERTVQRGDRERNGTFSLDAEVSFSADGAATLVLDGTRSYQINVITGAVVAQ
ncbi:hypothetical protein [Haliangium sp.]|uniref:hypothetical protein n=1 Tax=Haliangium sp. TaxID=2663208 RepID=UPI003D0CAC13